MQPFLNHAHYPYKHRDMKTHLFLIFSALFALASCEKETCNCYSSSNGIVGEWLLIEELVDPGDGSGTFQAVNSDKEIKFCDNGSYEANASMCLMTNQSDSTTYGTYDTSTETFSPENCMIMAPMAYRYSVSGDTLILSYPCIEACQQKYLRQ